MAEPNALNSKDARRKELKAARSALTAEERAAIDGLITQRVTSLDAYERADLLLPYLSFGAEVDTRALIADAWARGKRVALPRCVPGTREMRWYLVSSFDGLVKSPLGVDEPAGDEALEIDPASAHHALVIVPGLEFDRNGYRLGYGGGFYDVFLSSFSGTSAGLCRAQFLSETPLAHDSHDLPVNFVISQDEIVQVQA